MELRVLKYFLVVAREENITKAAELLHLTQPTLSRQIIQLEEELGTKLFNRGKTKMFLTDEGMLLRRRAQEIIELTEKTEREFSDKNNLVGGVISIGAGELYAVHYLAQFIAKFRKLYPQVQFDFFSGNVDQIREGLDKGLLDIGLLVEPADITKYDYKHTPIMEQYGVWMQKDCPLAEKEKIIPKDLIGLPLMVPKRNLTQRALEQWFGDDYQKLELIATYDLAYNLSIMVENGVGYAFGLDNIITEHEGRNLCFRPLDPVIEIGTLFVWKKHQIFSPAATQFIKAIKYAEKE